MVATYVDVTLRNPADPQQSLTSKFLVGSGAFDAMVPREHLEAIGLRPRLVFPPRRASTCLQTACPRPRT